MVDNYALVGDAALQVYDVSNPAAPVWKATRFLPGWIRSLTVAWPYVFAASGSAGVHVVDLSNPVNPLRVGTFDTDGYAEEIAVSGNRTYVADGPGGLQFLDWRQGIRQHLAVELPVSIELGAGPLILRPTASSALPVGISVLAGPGSVQDGELRLTGLGTAVLRFEQAGDGRFLPASITASIEARTAPPLARLEIRMTPSGLEAVVHASAGLSFDLEHCARLEEPSWISEFAVNLTNAIQGVNLAWPPDETRFWRLRAR